MSETTRVLRCSAIEGVRESQSPVIEDSCAGQERGRASWCSAVTACHREQEGVGGMPTRIRVSLAAAAVIGMVGAAAVVGTVGAAAAPAITPVIKGLNTPRGITFDSAGSMYVSESGAAGTGPAGLTQSGRVSKYASGSTTATWQTGFESLFVQGDPSQPPDVLGPEGISAFGPGCALFPGAQSTSPWLSGGSTGNVCTVRMIMSESHDGVLKESGGQVSTTQLGHLFALNTATGAATSVSDVGKQMYAFTGANTSLFPDDFPDSNPYGVLITKDRSGRVRTFVADAGANTIVEVNADGSTQVVAYTPNETTEPFRDSTPTCIAQGPDGMLYVATLDLVANFETPGRSHVFRIDPNATFDPKHPTAPQVWATGLTTATACTFDRAGNFWATEMFQPNSAGPPGDVIRIPFSNPTAITHIGGGSLPLPGGIAQGPDGAMYVTINSASPVAGSGAVVRISS